LLERADQELRLTIACREHSQTATYAETQTAMRHLAMILSAIRFLVSSSCLSGQVEFKIKLIRNLIVH
jgi:hypothetical protein